MKVHTTTFKEQIKEMGRELDSIITYGDTVLGNEQLNAVTPSFQSSILKSAMKQLDIDSNVYIPVGSVLKYEFGLKVNGEYEYINFGNYIVKDVEKQEDTNSYKITCYDKILLSMKDYAKMPITYPITIRDYINSMCNFLGLSFANRNNIFVNYNKEIPYELYLDNEGNSLGYTFRDVFDELAQVTASTICINDNDEVEIRYINDTGDTIDEEYLKDINVNFGEKYGKINSIVLSRSGQSDNVYLQDEASIAENGLTELKIIDNQIMNFNNRSDYLPEIFGKLNGLEYYLNDFSSTGITYYDICDRYNVKIGDTTYSCVMFNDEILVTQGLQENVFTEMPEETQTDYTKADKTDRKINQTYLIVDKQNQQIEAVISQTDEQNQKIAQVTQTVEELNSKIGDVADITISKDSNTGKLEFEDINQSEPIRIVVRPIGESISYLYPSNFIYPTNEYQPATIGLTPSETLTPSNTLVPRTERNAQDVLYPKTRTLRFHNITTDENFDLILPDDLLYLNSEIYDEFILDYDALSCVINKKLGYNEDGSIYILDKPTTIEYEYLHKELTGGDYEISLLGYDTAYLFVRLMSQNIYTTQFATKAELNSEIKQTKNEINASVSLKLDEEDFTSANIILKINDDTSYATIDADKISLEGKEINLTSDNINIKSENFNVDADGNLSCSNAQIIGGDIHLKSSETTSKIKITDSEDENCTFEMAARRLLWNGLNGGTLTFWNVASTPQIILSSSDGQTTEISSFYMSTPFINTPTIRGNSSNSALNLISQNGIASGGDDAVWISAGGNITLNPSGNAYVRKGDGSSYLISTAGGNISSLNLKENIEEFNDEEYQSAIDLLKKIKIYNYDYKYNVKEKEKDNKNNYGFIIDYVENEENADKFFKFEETKAIITENKNVDELGASENPNDENIISYKRYDEEVLVKYILTLCKAQQNEIDKLKEEIKLLKESDKNEFN